MANKSKSKSTAKPSEDTKKGIDFFDDKNEPVDMLEEVPFELSSQAGKQPSIPIRDIVFDWVEGKGSRFILAITTIAVSLAVYWMMVQ